MHVIGGVASVREGGDCGSKAPLFKWTKLKSKFGRDLAPR